MTAAVVSVPIDASAGTADIGTAIDALSPGAGYRVDSFTIGSKVRFYKYPIN